MQITRRDIDTKRAGVRQLRHSPGVAISNDTHDYDARHVEVNQVIQGVLEIPWEYSSVVVIQIREY